MYDERTDAQVIEAYLHGDTAAFEILVRRHSGSVYRFVHRLTGSSEDAYDITQEVFVKVWKHLARFEPSRRFTPWLFTIARTTAIDALRKRKNANTLPFSSLDFEDVEGGFEASLPDPEPLQDDIFARKELGAFLEQALERLPAHYRTVLVLHLYDDLTFEEIAEVLDRPMNTVKSHYRRAILALRKELG